MLRIKRASAGSGKTYELAKFYIKLLISSKRGDYRRQLLKDEAFRERLSSIMAVTFTVKATAEMKQRIVEKLADLGRVDDPSLSPADRKKIDYYSEFVADFRSDPYEIARLARSALRTLLLNYSDFKVQTIDSFFQSILHTFVYEASLDDNFNMEVNTEFVTSTGLGAALDSLSENGDRELLYWLRKLMDEKAGGNKWNVFARDESKKSLYSALIREAGNLEKEDYQSIKESLSDYFDSPDSRPFREVVEELDELNVMPFKKFHERRNIAAARLLSELADVGLDVSDLKQGCKTILKESVGDFDCDSFIPPEGTLAGRKVASAYSLSKNGEARLKESPLYTPELVDRIDLAFTEWAEAHNSYVAAFGPVAEGVMTWLQYRTMFPRLMVVLEIARRKDAYLKATNSLQIADTSHILAGIIGDDDAPFVYERMGSRLSHFLIDEFQDTSCMQWHNLKPFLHESDSRGEENLIIGDAKQSIYRFRNADYTIITGLEKEFSNIEYHTKETRPSEKESSNTNYRSRPKIVEFNNHVFSNILTLTAGKESSSLFTPTIREIYRDCRQALPEGADKGRPGYVEVNFYPKKREDQAEDGATLSLADEPGFSSLPERILELRGRGYAFGDIGILVKSHEQGFAAVSVISAYNQEHPESPIPIISEENLLVASSFSVKIIIHALETAAAGMRVKTEPNPVISDPVDDELLFDILRSLNTLSLPSVVEAIVGAFVPPERRCAEAPFIAAFQDAVLDYCAGRPSDIGSFLKWWRRKSGSLSITSPEDSDGVKLQTIHKSKGLEYKCVIIPSASFSFHPGNFTEWRWVEVSEKVKGHESLPPRLPVLTGSSLEATSHSAELVRYREEYALDELNKMYVAFTRAVEELYVYVPLTKRQDDWKAGGTLTSLLVGNPLEGSGIDGEENGRQTVRYGIPAPPEEIAEEKERRALKERQRRAATFSLYAYESAAVPNSRFKKDEDGAVEEEERQTLLFHNDNPLKTIVYPDGREEEIDPRAEGTLKHRLLQMVTVPADLEKALRRMKVEGIVSAAQAEAWGRELREAIESVEGRRWFAPEMKVFTERPVLRKGLKRVPDRVVVSPEGDAVVIDYKFGEEEEGYGKQIGEYAELLRQTGRFRKVNAYLWYVPKRVIEEVG